MISFVVIRVFMDLYKNVRRSLLWISSEHSKHLIWILLSKVHICLSPLNQMELPLDWYTYEDDKETSVKKRNDDYQKETVSINQ